MNSRRLRLTSVLAGVLFLAGAASAAPSLSPPASPGASATSGSAIRVTWTDTNKRESGYRIERSPSATTGFVQVGSTGKDATSFHNTGLASETRYYYRVRAFRSKGGTSYSSYSAVVSATTSQTDSSPPNVSITSPSSGTTYTSASKVGITASASDNVGVTKVEFRRNGSLVRTDTSAPYTVSWSISTSQNGSHSWSAKAFDAAGNTRTSSSVSLTVDITSNDTTLPSVSITSPANGTSYTSAQTVTINASASDNVGVTKVEFRRNGALMRTDTSAPYTASWSISESQNGSHSWSAKAFDAAGNTRTSSSVSLTVDITPNDTTLPSVSITSPANGTSYTSAQTVSINASASDNVGVTKVEFRRNGALMRTDTSAPYTASWSISESQNGSHSWSAKAFDAAGNTRTSSSVSLTVDITPNDTTLPSVSITSPANGTSYTSAQTVTVNASASDNVGVTKVEFRRNGALMRTDTSAPYTASWSISESQNGSHSWSAKAFDAAGNTRTSSSVSLTVDITPNDTTLPSVSITSPANGTSYTSAQTVTVNASASDNVGVTKVEFRRNGALMRTDTSAPYTASWSISESQNGSHSWSAKAFDAAGNTRTSSSVSLTVDITPNDTTLPSVSITSPANGTSYTSAQTVTINASASDNVGVTKVEFYDGGAWKRTDMTAPYTASWSFTEADNGNHSWTARAFDAAGNTRTSSAASLTVNIGSADTTLPNVSITSPSNGTSYTSAQTVTISASASDNVGVTKVEFRRNGALVRTDTAAPYTESWSFSDADNGSHSWTARAFDAAGNTRTSSTVNLTVNIGVVLGDPELVGFLPGIGTAMNVAVDGAEAFVASADFGLSVLDIASAGAPELLGSAEFPFTGLHTAVRGNLAVVAGKQDSMAHLWVLDLSDATMPLVLGELATNVVQVEGGTTGFKDIALDATGTLAVAAMGADGLWVIDLSNPADPRLVGTYNTPGTAYGVALDGSVAYVADLVGDDLQVISVASPSQPTLMASKSLSGAIYDVAVAGDVAYLIARSGGVKVLDVSDPSAPWQIASAGTTYSTAQVVIEGTRLVVFEVNSSGNAFEVFDVSNPASPQLTATVDLADGRGVALAGGLVYAADGSEGFAIYDVDSSTPALTGAFADEFEASVIAEADGIAVVGGRHLPSGMARLQLIDAGVPTDPVLLGELATNVVQVEGGTTGFKDIALDATGTLAVAAMGADGLWVIDLSNPADPRLVGTYNTPGTAYGVALDGSVAYVADLVGDDLQVISVASPSQPTLMASKSLSGAIYDVAVAGDVAYLIARSGGVKVLDVSDPSAPWQIASAGTTYSTAQVVIEGTRLVVFEVNSSGNAFEVFDVSNPASPQLTATVDLADGRGVALAGGLVYAADGSEGLAIYDIQGISPTLAASVATPGDATGVSTGAGRACVADSASAIAIIE